jgi:DNA-directed RNA polymerase specialized sigma subunit
VYIPRRIYDEISKWLRKKIELQYQLGRTPTNVEIAKSLGLNSAIAQRVLVSLNFDQGVPIDPEDKKTIDTHQEDMETKEEIEKMKVELPYIGEREQRVLVRHYGLDKKEPESYGDLAGGLGLSRAGVHCIEKRALNELRERMEKKWNSDKKNH